MVSKKDAAIGFIFITILVDMIGFGIIIPVMPDLISSLKHVPINTAATYGSWLMSAYAATQFIFAPIIGGLSDHYGRRKILLLSLLGFSIDYIFLALAPSYGWLFVGRIIAGITGASFTTASAYIADVSTPETRAKNYGMIGAAFGMGFIIGPVIGGFLGKFGLRVPFYGAAILCAINWLYGFFVLPESLAPENRRPFDILRSNPVGSVKQIKKYPSIAWLLVSVFLLYMASHAVQSHWSYFGKYRFQWSETMIGISLGVVGALVAIVQGGLIRVINPKLGNEKSVYVGLLMYSIGLILFAFAAKTWMMFVFLIPYCLGGIAGPALQSLMSSRVPANAQGELQGIFTSMMSLTAIFGPPLMNNLFFYFTKDGAPVHFPGAAFLMGAVFMLASTVVAYFTVHKPVVSTT
ncbi:MAG: TCR/Tet family MFS transporter [Bacteroidetes bacterium]|nr:TCR/Tet family MFS transporter [Bacteroidota bacterium]